MTPLTPSRTATRLLAAVAAVALFAVVIGQLRQSAPYAPGEFLVEGAEDPTDPSNDLLTCERTLPDRPTTPEGAEEPEPVGRVTSSQVIECPEVFDGHVVTYIGEVIGDVIQRDGGAWVLMNDDAYALEVGPLSSHGEHRGYNSGLSVWLDGDLADLADRPGGPAWRGDVLLVRGVVHRTDPADGGGLTLRASSGEVLSEARELDVPLHRGQAVVAVVMVVLALGALALERRRAARR